MRIASSRWGSVCALAWLVMALPLVASAQQGSPEGAAAAPAAKPMVAVDASTADVADIPFAAANAAAPSVPSAADAWGGERTGSEATLSDRVVSYRIDAELDAAKHAVSGKEQHAPGATAATAGRAASTCICTSMPSPTRAARFFTEREVLTAHGSSRGNAALKKGEWGWIDLKQRAPGRYRPEVDLRAAGQRPGHRPHRGAHRSGPAGAGRRHADAGYRLPQPAAAGGGAHRLVRRFQPGRAVVSQDRRAGTAGRARRHARCAGTCTSSISTASSTPTSGCTTSS